MLPHFKLLLSTATALLSASAIQLRNVQQTVILTTTLTATVEQCATISVSATASIGMPLRSESSMPPSSLTATAAFTGATATATAASSFRTTLDLQDGVRLTFKNGTELIGPREVNLPALTGAADKIEFDLRMSRYEGVFKSSCHIKSTHGAQDFSAKLSIKADGLPNGSNGYIWLECSKEGIDEEVAPLVNIRIVTSIEVTFTNPPMFFGQPLSVQSGETEKTITFQGLSVNKRDNIEFDVAYRASGNTKFLYKLGTRNLKDQAGTASFSYVPTGWSNRFPEGAYVRLKQDTPNSVGVECTCNKPNCDGE